LVVTLLGIMIGVGNYDWSGKKRIACSLHV
jgi:hypothetical protein